MNRFVWLLATVIFTATTAATNALTLKKGQVLGSDGQIKTKNNKDMPLNSEAEGLVHVQECKGLFLKPLDGDNMPKEWSQPHPCAPELIAADDIPIKIQNDMQKTLLEASKEWGNFGPIEYWVLGTHEQSAKKLIEKYCSRRAERGDIGFDQCKREELSSNIKHNMISYQKIGARALNSGRPEQSAGHTGGQNWGIHRFMSSLPLGMAGRFGIPGEENQKVILHEYFHAFQIAHARSLGASRKKLGPIWFMEGSAEYMALVAHDKLTKQSKLRRWKNGRYRFTFKNEMKKRFKHAKELEAKFDCVKSKMKEAFFTEKCNDFTYNGDVWAIALLVNQTNEKVLINEFYPNVYDLGWEKAFEKSFGKTPNEFYKEFETFMRKSYRDASQIL